MNPASEAELAAWLAARSDRAIETACARVFLAGDTALKIKRHVDLGYVDFSTLDRRLWALRRELEFNRATAPDIYRAVRPITREADGSLALEGAGVAVDHVLEMRRFDDQAVLAEQPQALDGTMAEALGRALADFHSAAPLRPQDGLAGMAYSVGSNANLLRGLRNRLGEAPVEQLIDLTEAELECQVPLLAKRSASGFARRCHGDLHLGNILVEDGRSVLFDCIEFSDLLSDIDVQYDLAFLLMDLDFRGRRDAAARALSAWLDQGARAFPQAIWEGQAALPLMLSMRAAVRAHVHANGGKDSVARRYLETAIAHLSPAPPSLVAVGGLSGTGKSTFARAIAPALGASPGAVVLRSDEVRKRIMGVAPTQALPASGYTPQADARTFEALFAAARSLLAAGRTVVLDTTFLDPAIRNQAEQLAADLSVPFHGAWLEAPLEVLDVRVTARTGDASNAGVQVLHAQAARPGDPPAWPRVDASQVVSETGSAWLTALSVELI